MLAVQHRSLASLLAVMPELGPVAFRKQERAHLLHQVDKNVARRGRSRASPTAFTDRSEWIVGSWTLSP